MSLAKHDCPYCHHMMSNGGRCKGVRAAKELYYWGPYIQPSVIRGQCDASAFGSIHRSSSSSSLPLDQSSL